MVTGEKVRSKLLEGEISVVWNVSVVMVCWVSHRGKNSYSPSLNEHKALSAKSSFYFFQHWILICAAIPYPYINIHQNFI